MLLSIKICYYHYLLWCSLFLKLGHSEPLKDTVFCVLLTCIHQSLSTFLLSETRCFSHFLLFLPQPWFQLFLRRGYLFRNEDLVLGMLIAIQVLFLLGEGNGTPLQYSCLENPMDGGAWCAVVHGVAESWTRLSDFTFTFHFHAWRRKWQPTPVFLPGESQGRWSLVGCRLWGPTESDTTEVT